MIPFDLARASRAKRCYQWRHPHGRRQPILRRLFNFGGPFVSSFHPAWYQASVEMSPSSFFDYFTVRVNVMLWLKAEDPEAVVPITVRF